MVPRGKLTYRLRVPVALPAARRRRRRRVGLRGGYRPRRSSRKMRGGFLPFIAPLIAAAIGAIPGIASVAIQAANNNK